MSERPWVSHANLAYSSFQRCSTTRPRRSTPGMSPSRPASTKEVRRIHGNAFRRQPGELPHSPGGNLGDEPRTPQPLQPGRTDRLGDPRQGNQHNYRRNAPLVAILGGWSPDTGSFRTGDEDRLRRPGLPANLAQTGCSTYWEVANMAVLGWDCTVG